MCLTRLFVASLVIVTTSYSQVTHFRSGIFLHHSTGAAIWGPNGSSTSVPQEIANYNSSHGYVGANAVTLSEAGWPVTPWTNEWERWHRIFDNQDPDADIQPYFESEKIIIIKSCFPSSSMSGIGSATDTLSPTTKSMYNYKWHWQNIINVMRQHPENFFVIWTNAPLVPDETSDNAAHLSDMFCRWAKDTLAAGNDPIFGAFPDNVYVFDFFHKLTGSDGKMLLQYASSSSDSHPNSGATELVAPQFVQEIFDAAIAYESGEVPSLPVPALKNPPNACINQAYSPLLVWTSVEGASNYRLQLSNDSTFGSLILDSTMTSTSSRVGPLADNSTFFWHVQAGNGADTSSWSNVWRFSTAPATAHQYPVFARWNLISIPLNVSNRSVQVVFPNATSRAFAYDGYFGYTSKESLALGNGYWLKFGYDQVVCFDADTINTDTIDLVQGWNIIGSITSPVDVSSIQSIPGGVTTSDFFGFDDRYSTSDTIQPGRGYWVRVGEDCQLILSSSHALYKNSSTIQIIHGDEQPPPPPEDQAPQQPNRSNLPIDFSLGQNYPNPFNPSTDIRYSVSDARHVSLRVYDVLGREIRTLVDEEKEPGEYTVRWDASNVPSGIYFCRIVAGTYVDARKMIVVK